MLLMYFMHACIGRHDHSTDVSGKCITKHYCYVFTLPDLRSFCEAASSKTISDSDDDIFQLHSDESFPPLPPPMSTLDELRKKQSSTSWRLPSSMPAPIEPPSFQSKRNTTPEKNEFDDFGPPRSPPRKRSRKVRLIIPQNWPSPIFGDLPSSQPASRRFPFSQPMFCKSPLLNFHPARSHLPTLCSASRPACRISESLEVSIYIHESSSTHMQY